jgi:hypothetical protein
MRDKGIEQTGLIAYQTLQLPIEMELLDLSHSAIESLDCHTTDVIIDQPIQTKSMPVNPYQAFNPLPAAVALSPSVDHWSEVQLQGKELGLLPPEKMRNADGAYEFWGKEITVQDWTETSIRSLQVHVTASGFGLGEPVQVIFDGIPVPCTSDVSDMEGNFDGWFTIPEGVPGGTKLVTLQGTHTVGYATYEASRFIISVRYTWVALYTNDPYYCKVDPIAQTFTLPANRHVAGIDFWLYEKGDSDLVIEIRETTAGLPADTILNVARKSPGDLNEGGWNRALFDVPIALTGGVEYALVIKSDSPDYTVGIAEIGDWHSELGWIRSQVDPIGVLLSSANASTWTPHQTSDLAFRLLGAVFDVAAPKAVELASHDLTGITDVMFLAEIDHSSADTDVTFILSKDGSEVIRMQPYQAISFAAPLEGVHAVSAELSGSSLFSPILGPDPQLLTGVLQTTGDYVSRSFKCGTDKRVMVTIDAISPGTSSIDVSVLTGADAWTLAELDDYEELGDGWRRRFYYVPCELTETKIKIELTGDAASRPMVMNIRGVVLNNA